jgi:hypothetical protein
MKKKFKALQKTATSLFTILITSSITKASVWLKEFPTKIQLNQAIHLSEYLPLNSELSILTNPQKPYFDPIIKTPLKTKIPYKISLNFTNCEIFHFKEKTFIGLCGDQGFSLVEYRLNDREILEFVKSANLTSFPIFNEREVDKCLSVKKWDIKKNQFLVFCVDLSETDDKTIVEFFVSVVEVNEEKFEMETIDEKRYIQNFKQLGIENIREYKVGDKRRFGLFRISQGPIKLLRGITYSVNKSGMLEEVVDMFNIEFMNLDPHVMNNTLSEIKEYTFIEDQLFLFYTQNEENAVKLKSIKCKAVDTETFDCGQNLELVTKEKSQADQFSDLTIKIFKTNFVKENGFDLFLTFNKGEDTLLGSLRSDSNNSLTYTSIDPRTLKYLNNLRILKNLKIFKEKLILTTTKSSSGSTLLALYSLTSHTQSRTVKFDKSEAKILTSNFDQKNQKSIIILSTPKSQDLEYVIKRPFSLEFQKNDISKNSEFSFFITAYHNNSSEMKKITYSPKGIPFIFKLIFGFVGFFTFALVIAILVIRKKRRRVLDDVSFADLEEEDNYNEL